MLLVPPSGRYLWRWYFDLCDSLRRVRDGVCEPFPPSEFMAWKEATARIVYADEYAILRAMDVVFCEETNKELTDYRERQKARQEAEIEAARNKSKRGKR